jgi:glycosyltransferase involved in cell wall biosynthesis
MKLLLVTDAWQPQVNGVVTTLVELVQALDAMGVETLVIEPSQFNTRPCPGYPGIDIALRPGAAMRQRFDTARVDAVHIATEGPLGWAARRECLRRGWPFTTAFHTRFPEILQAALKLPLWAGYAVFRHFHKPSAGIMVPAPGTLALLHERGLRPLKEWTHGVDTDLFHPRLRDAPPPVSASTHPACVAKVLQAKADGRPVLLYVGRVSYEKNIAAYLDMPFDGIKLVCGEGPVRPQLEKAYPQAHWLGVLPRDLLAWVYAQASVFVFPSKADTFGLVLLEAMACGTPIAAYPEPGPRAVLGVSHGATPAGAMDENLAAACASALQACRQATQARASCFGWPATAERFASLLVPLQGPR